MTAESSPTETIYIRLLDEGTDVWRPTQGRKVGPMTFEILETPSREAQGEQWQFLPGMVVIARFQRHGPEVLLEAWRRAPTLERDETTDLADEVARRAGLEVRRSGALRLIPSPQALGFLDRCAAERLFITYAESFELDDGHPQSVEWGGGHEFTLRETGLNTPRLEQVRAFVERTQAQDRWFDFVVHRPRSEGFHWSRCPIHVAALPRPHPGLRLIESPPVRTVKAALDSRRGESDLLVADVPEGIASVDAQRILRDLAVLLLGERLPSTVRLTRPRAFWRTRLERVTALRYLSLIIATDIAYGDPCVDAKVAEDAVAALVGLFGSDASFFTYREVTPEGKSAGGERLTDETMEEGLGIFDGKRAAILFVTDED